MNELANLRKTMRTFPEDETVDAVVIGTGAGGAPILAKLAKIILRLRYSIAVSHQQIPRLHPYRGLVIGHAGK